MEIGSAAAVDRRLTFQLQASTGLYTVSRSVFITTLLGSYTFSCCRL